MSKISSFKLLDAATATGNGNPEKAWSGPVSFQGYGTTSASTGAAVITVQVSNFETPVLTTDVDWMTLGQITLTLGTTQTSEGFVSELRFRHVRCKVASISGTNATVSVWMANEEP